MIKSITIKDFQIHKGLKVVLDPRVTTIVGPSDVGKSAIIRALLWVATNKPTGDAYIREGGKSTYVRIVVDDQRVRRERGSGKNSYRLNDRTFRAFGNDVPDVISDLLNIGNISYQAQHDSPFWFAETAGEVSRQLNQIVNLGAIDQTLANLATALRKVKMEQTVIQQRLEKVTSERKDLKYIRKVDQALAAAEGLETQWQEAAQRLLVFEALQKEAATHREATTRASQAAERCRKAAKLGNHWAVTVSRRKTLQDLLSNISQLTAFVKKPIPDLSELGALCSAWGKKASERTGLQTLLAKIKQIQSTVSSATAEHKKQSKKFSEVLGKECPLCGQRTSAQS